MSCKKCLVIVILACATCAMVAKTTTMNLDTAINQTVCRTEVLFDTDLDRIPKTIKMIKCATEPYKMCPTGNGGSMRCCGALTYTGAAKLSCTEVMDNVMVKYATNTTESVFKVAIGCSCIEQNSNQARDPE